MAKFIVTNGSYFDPFTYEELAKPIINAQAEHNAAEEAYDALSMETSALERYIGEGEGNVEARKLYDSYQEKLVNLQNALWEQGVNANTRRGLAAARNGYASDIARLQKAIQSRQELSKEWSDARKRNPNLVTGANPGDSGLDNYLADDTYGQNWFSYDSAQFEKEVGTEAQARARELLRGLTDSSGVIKNPSLKNMLTRVITQGFTNEETMQAGAVVDAILSLSPEDRQAFYEQGQISEPVKILAESLINRYNATGINESDASDADRAILLGRGKAGFSYGVLGKDVKDFSDPDYEMWAAKEKMRYQNELAMEMQALKNAARNSSSENSTGNKENDSNSNIPGYTFNSIISRLQDPNYDKLRKITGGKEEQYAGRTYQLVSADGQSSETIDSPWTMSEKVFNPEERKIARQVFGGMDVLMDVPANVQRTEQRKTYIVTTKDGTANARFAGRLGKNDTERLGAGLGKNAVGIFRLNGTLDQESTLTFNELRKKAIDHIEAIRKQNPNLDIDGLSITPKEQEKLRNSFNETFSEERQISPLVDASDLRSVLESSARYGEYKPAVVASSDVAFAPVRESYGNALISTLQNLRASAGGELGAGDPRAIYTVGKGGKVVSSTGTSDLVDVFGGDKNVEGNNMGVITIFPEDVIGGVANRPMVRFTTPVSDKTFITDAYNFGDPLGPQLDRIKPAVQTLMLPIINPSMVLQMSDNEAQELSAIIYSTLNSANTQPGEFIGPSWVGSDGMRHEVASAKEMVRNPTYRDQLYGSITKFINDAVSVPRDEVNQNAMQRNSGTSSKPSPMI